MKKLVVLAAVCCAMVFSGCSRQQENYNAQVSEYHFANSDNVISVKAILGTVKSMWEGDFYYKGEKQGACDIKANVKFRAAVAAILLHTSELKPYFADEEDYFVYTMRRTTDGENTILVQVKFFINNDGILATEDIVNKFKNDTQNNDEE